MLVVLGCLGQWEIALPRWNSAPPPPHNTSDLVCCWPSSPPCHSQAGLWEYPEEKHPHGVPSPYRNQKPWGHKHMILNLSTSCCSWKWSEGQGTVSCLGLLKLDFASHISRGDTAQALWCGVQPLGVGWNVRALSFLLSRKWPWSWVSWHRQRPLCTHRLASLVRFMFFSPGSVALSCSSFIILGDCIIYMLISNSRLSLPWLLYLVFSTTLHQILPLWHDPTLAFFIIGNCTILKISTLVLQFFSPIRLTPQSLIPWSHYIFTLHLTTISPFSFLSCL